MRVYVRVVTWLLLPVVFVICVLGWLLRSEVRNDPAVAVDRDAHNWGRVIPGSEVSTEFEIRNIGGEPLLLGEPRTSCGCTKPKVDQKPILPGESRRIQVRFHVPDKPGTVSHFVLLPTNDPKKKEVQLYLYAHAWVGVRSAPQVADLGTIQPGSTVEKVIQLSSSDRKPFRLGYIEADRPQITWRVEDPDASQTLHRIHVAYRSKDEVGPIVGGLRVVTDREDTPSIGIPVIADVAGPFSIKPSEIRIEKNEIGKVVQRKLIVRSNVSASRIEIAEVKVKEPWVLVNHQIEANQSGYMILGVSLRFPTGRGDDSGEMTLKLAGEQAAVQTIPLTISGWTPPLPAVSR